MISSALVLYIGGINSSNGKGYKLIFDGYNCLIPAMTSHNMAALAAILCPSYLSSLVRGYLGELRVEALNCTKDSPDIVVGVSQGGAVAMSLQQTHWPSSRLVLIAPAWKAFGVAPVINNAVILHSESDWLINPADSKLLSAQNNCRLVLVKDNHYLGNSYPQILAEVDRASQDLGLIVPRRLK